MVSHRAGAAIGAQAIGAGPAILTGLRVALILLVLTEHPIKTRTATANEVIDPIYTSPIIQAGAGKKIVVFEGGGTGTYSHVKGGPFKLFFSPFISFRSLNGDYVLKCFTCQCIQGC